MDSHNIYKFGKWMTDKQAFLAILAEVNAQKNGLLQHDPSLERHGLQIGLNALQFTCYKLQQAIQQLKGTTSMWGEDR